MLTKVYSRDNEHLMDILNSRIQEIPGVTATETMIIFGAKYQERNSYSNREINGMAD